jgi:hypothetical protein
MAQTRVGVRPRPTSSIITDGLVLHLDAGNTSSYPGTGTIWSDLTGNGNNGTLTNGASYLTDNGGIMSFDGINDYIEIGATGQGPLYDIGTGDFTVNMWCAKDTTSTYGWFISNFDSVVGGFAMGTWADTTSLYWRIYPGGWTDSGYNISSDLSFHNYTLTRNSGTVDVYVDAILVDGSNAGFTGTLSSELVPTYLGGRSDGFANQPWNGNIGPVHIYNRALSSTEVLQNYNATKDRFGL